MTGLAYAELLEKTAGHDLCGRAFTLHLGPWEIAAVPYATVSTLADEPGPIEAILADCFIDRAVLCEKLDDADDVVSPLAELRALKIALADKERLLAVAPESSAVVLCEVVRRWQEATDDAIAGLSQLGPERSGRVRAHRALEVHERYRRRALGAVSALVQLLTDGGDSAVAARRAYAVARSALLDIGGQSADDLQEASWFPADEPEDDGELASPAGGAVTWGIP